MYRILNTNFVCLNSDEFDNSPYHHINHHDSLFSPTNGTYANSSFNASGDDQSTATTPITPYPLFTPTESFDEGDGVAGVDESPIYKVNKLLSSGDFYYSDKFDISSNLQERIVSNLNFISSLECFDGRYVWNRHLLTGLLSFKNRLSVSDRESFDQGAFLVPIIRGFAQTLTVNDSYLLSIISKQDCLKQGEMFGPYCMDDDGNVTGFIETELIISDNKDLMFSFVLLRGNVPLFWKFESQLLSTKIEFPRSIEASRHSIERFFEGLVTKFGGVQIVDALSRRGSQPELSEI
ncbi:unnamed protein product [Ambrosiozyma monospora]|uniref:Unnamed protein product n=1 Tax=Ambrosiozyma monospora TaxID=43982 RepID=A0ACB5TX38_AMBMO|nr:unnamed protein product [Ambrosiozyma monospora]